MKKKFVYLIAILPLLVGGLTSSLKAAHLSTGTAKVVLLPPGDDSANAVYTLYQAFATELMRANVEVFDVWDMENTLSRWDLERVSNKTNLPMVAQKMNAQYLIDLQMSALVGGWVNTFRAELIPIDGKKAPKPIFYRSTMVQVSRKPRRVFQESAGVVASQWMHGSVEPAGRVSIAFSTQTHSAYKKIAVLPLWSTNFMKEGKDFSWSVRERLNDYGLNLVARKDLAQVLKNPDIEKDELMTAANFSLEEHSYLTVTPYRFNSRPLPDLAELKTLRKKTGADILLFGSVASDFPTDDSYVPQVATLRAVDLKTGKTVLRAVYYNALTNPEDLYHASQWLMLGVAAYLKSANFSEYQKNLMQLAEQSKFSAADLKRVYGLDTNLAASDE